MIYVLSYLWDDSSGYTYEKGILDFTMTIMGYAFVMEIPYLLNIAAGIAFILAIIGLLYGYVTIYPDMREE